MSIRGFEINKGIVGAASNIEDNISAILANGAAVAAAGDITGVVLGTAYEITSVSQAETMGIDAAYDTANKTILFHHIKEFFRIAGEGTKLWIMVCPAAKTMKNMIEEYGESLIIASKGAINYLAVSYNPGAAYEPVLVDGMEQVVREAIAPAQTLADWAWDSDRPLHILLEGRGISGVIASMVDLRDLTEGAAALIAPQVTICIGQDWDFAEELTGEAQNYADVGTLMASKAALPCNRNVAEVETMDLSDAARGVWLTAGLSNHVKIDTVEEDLASYDAKGYVFGLTYTGVSGVRWNDDHVCAPAGIDDNGYIKVSSMAHSAVINKCARMLRKRLLPKVKSTVPVNTQTGLLPTPIIKYFEGLGNRAFEYMARPEIGEISGGKTIVDPTSDLLSGAKELKVSFWVVPTASVGKIKGTITLKKSL
jgi:hypothetical protein